MLLSEEPVMVLGDNDLITQVIYNLLENAAKFAAPGTAFGLDEFKHANAPLFQALIKGTQLGPAGIGQLLLAYAPDRPFQGRQLVQAGVGVRLGADLYPGRPAAHAPQRFRGIYADSVKMLRQHRAEIGQTGQ